MTFSLWSPPSLTPEQSGAMPDLLSKILSGYSGVTNARYLKPNLEQALQKAKLFNQYYGPEKESEIGLRGAQAGHLGSLTTGQNIANKFAPQRLRSEQEQREFKSQNPLLGMAGNAGQMGALAYLHAHPELGQLFGQVQGNTNQQNQNQVVNNQPQMGSKDNGQSFINPAIPQNNIQSQQAPIQPSYEDMMRDSILNSMKPKVKSNPLSTAQDYAKNQESVYGKESDEAKLAKDYVQKLAHGTPTQKNEALEQHREKMDNMAVWKSLPVTAKAHAIAIGQGAGFSGDETARFLASGGTMKDLLYQHGIKDESEVEPVYQLTTAAQTAQLQRQFASKEADYLSEFIRNATGEYARTVAGYSPKLIKDQLEGKNEDKQAEVLAARGLSPELVNLRLMRAGAKSTVDAQKQMRDKAMLDIKNFRPLVSTKVWTKVQTIMDRELKKTFEAGSKGFGQKISNAIKKHKGDNDPLGIR